MKKKLFLIILFLSLIFSLIFIGCGPTYYRSDLEIKKIEKISENKYVLGISYFVNTINSNSDNTDIAIYQKIDNETEYFIKSEEVYKYGYIEIEIELFGVADKKEKNIIVYYLEKSEEFILE